MRGYLKTSNWMFKLQPTTTTVGKNKDSDLWLQNGGVDEHHATIEWNEMEQCYVLSDLNSVHGTYVNDCRIHNATVHLTIGDELHFGYGGSAYKLLMEPADPLPVLRSQSSASSAKIRSHVRPSPVTPHPPSRPRPASAGAKCTDLGPKNLKSMSQCYRSGRWANSTGRGIILRNVSMLQRHHSMQDLLQDEGCMRCKEQPNDVFASHDETQRKECVIRALRDEISALQLQLSQNSKSDPNIRQKLSNLAQDIQEKKEEIQQLKQQMLEMQTRSVELTGQTVAERDQRINSLTEELDNLTREKNKSAALVSSLQKDLLAREKQVLKLAAEIDKLRNDVKYKDAKLSNMANKLTKLKQFENHQGEFLAREKEVESLKKSVERLASSMSEKQKELMQQNTERDLLKHKLEQMTREQTSFQAEMDKLKLLQQHTLQRELKAQTELKHTQTRLEYFYSQIIKHVLFTSETLSEQEMLERLSVIAKQNEVLSSRVQELEQNLQECNEIQKVVEEDTEKLKGKLAEFQHNVQHLFLMDAIQSQIYALRDVSVCSTVSWVQTHFLTILSSLRSLVQDTADKLLSTGIEVSEKTGGVSGAIETLCQQHQEIQSELKSLKKQQKEQLEVSDAYTDDLKSKLEVMRQELEHQKLQASEQQLNLEGTVKLQLEKTKADLESARKAEAALRLEMEEKDMNWRTKLEEAETRENVLMERIEDVELQEQKWRERMKEDEEKEKDLRKRVEDALQRGAEEERERIQLEIEEYREQMRQHAYTIVAMEKQMTSAQQREQEMQVERDSLTNQLREALIKLEDETPSASPEQSKEEQQLIETVSSLRASLRVSQNEVVKQGELIASLSHDLAHAHARLSDLTGELSEQQKIELEAHKALVVDQRMQLNMLKQKLTVTSQELGQKDEELKTLREKLIKAEENLRSLLERENREKDESQIQNYTQCTKDVAVMVSPSDLTAQRLKCKGRHGEMICQQKQDLNAVKERISAVEQKWSYIVSAQQREPVTRGQIKPVQTPSRNLQRAAGLRRKDSVSAMSGFAFPEALSEAALERTARLDLSDALDISEKTYVDLSRALCEALELSEEQLSGCVSLKHLRSGERVHMASLRQEDLELFRSCLTLQNSQSQNKDLLLQESQREIQTLRECQAVGQQLQVELDNIRSELDTLKQERDTLHQALQDAQNQLQHCSKNRNHMALNSETIGGRSRRVGHHNCVPNQSYDKVAVRKKSRQLEKKKRKEAEPVNLRRENWHKEQVSCRMAVHLASIPQQQQQQNTEVTETP